MEGSQSEAKEEENDQKGQTLKGKSCKGYLYYSSIRKSKDRNPFCVGLTKNLHQVPGYIIGQSEKEASKEGRSLTDFKYACVGYSVFLDNKDPSADPKKKPVELPFCVGIELLVDKVAPSTAGHVPHAPAHAHNTEDEHVLPQPPPRPYRPAPAHSTRDDFLERLTRNAGLVASGVSKNMHRVGNYIKSNINDVLYPYRRRPK